MTALPAAGYMSNSARTQAEMKAALDAIPAFLRERLGDGTGWTAQASGTTVTLGALTARLLSITGTTAITSFGTTAPTDGVPFKLKFAASLTLTNGALLILPGGANIVTAANDVAEVVWEGSNVWRVIDYQRASGLALVSQQSLTLGTAIATTSGTAIDFTGLPSTVKRIMMLLGGVSLSGTGVPLIQIGSGSPLTSGYSAASANLGAATAFSTPTNGFQIGQGSIAADALSGVVILDNVTANAWCCSAQCGVPAGSLRFGSGVASLGGALDRVRLTSSNGTDTFDAGSVNIAWE